MNRPHIHTIREEFSTEGLRQENLRDPLKTFQMASQIHNLVYAILGVLSITLKPYLNWSLCISIYEDNHVHSGYEKYPYSPFLHTHRIVFCCIRTYDAGCKST